jgi:hypothetical protein
MRVRYVLAAVGLSLGLSGCYTAESPLLNEANSVAPYGKITFREESNKDSATLTRTGTAYTIPSEDGSGTLTLRFQATDRPNWYIAQMSAAPSDNGFDLLYAVLRIDLAKREAVSFKAIAADPKESSNGFHICNDIVCIDDLKAYAKAAFDYADKGGSPDVTYEISVE